MKVTLQPGEPAIDTWSLFYLQRIALEHHHYP